MRSSSLPSDGALPVEVRQRRVERLAGLHELELAVLDPSLVAPELLDVGLHRLELARRADLTRVHLGLDLGGLLRQRARLVVEVLLLAGDDVALGAHGCDAAVERGGVALRARQGLAFGKRLVTVEEPVERAVVLLEREERFELLAHWPVVPAGAAVGGAVAGGAVAGGAVGAGVVGAGVVGCCCTVGSCGRAGPVLLGGSAPPWPPRGFTVAPGRAHTGPGSGSGSSG